MPAPYGLGYGMGAIGAGLAQGQLAATMMKPGLQHQQMQNQMLQQQMDEKQGLQLAAQNAIDPATGQLDYEKYYAEAAKVSPNFASQLNLRQAQIQKAGAQTAQIEQKAKSEYNDQQKSEIARHIAGLMVIEDPEERAKAGMALNPKLIKAGVHPFPEGTKFSDDFLNTAVQHLGLKPNELVRSQAAAKSLDIKETTEKNKENYRRYRLDLDWFKAHLAQKLGNARIALGRQGVEKMGSWQSQLYKDIKEANPNLHPTEIGQQVADVLASIKDKPEIPPEKVAGDGAIKIAQASGISDPKRIQKIRDGLLPMAQEIATAQRSAEQGQGVVPRATQARPQTKANVETTVNPANGKTYYKHPDGKFYLAPPQ